MYGRRYRLLIGRAYGVQQTFDPSGALPDPRDITTEFVGETFSFTGGRGTGLVDDYKRQSIYRKRTPEEIASIQQTILASFVEQSYEYAARLYDDSASFEEAAGWLNYDNIVIEDHHIEFTVEKVGSNSADGNQSEITIHNLSDSTAELLGVLAATQNFVELAAGYEDEELRVIVRGNMKFAEDIFDGDERRTKIIVNDGGNFAQNQMSTRVYPKGTTISKIVNDIIVDSALPRGFVELPDDAGAISKPLIVHGKSVEQLKRVLDTFGYSVNIQDMYINIYKRALEESVAEDLAAIELADSGNASSQTSITVRKSAGGRRRTVTLISPETGLLASPSFTTDVSDQTPQEVANESANGIKFKHLLSGELTPNAYIKLQTDRIVGIYRILKVKHRGSLEGSEWITEVWAEKIVQQTVDTQPQDEPEQQEQQERGILEAPASAYGFHGRSVEPPKPTRNTGAFGGFQR